MELMDKIEAYWTDRAQGYSQVNQEELATSQKEKWRENLLKHFPGKRPEEIKVLDIGTGPGFFAILLAEAGFQVYRGDAAGSQEKRRESGRSDPVAADGCPGAGISGRDF